MLISVVIPNWNGAPYLPTCLHALRRQTLPPLEVIVVDNASSDDSQQLIRTHFPEVTLLALPDNRRFAGACNAGIRAASQAAEAIALLNNDTEADPRWLERAARCLRAHPDAGFVASKLRLFDRREYLHLSLIHI